jgi:predicted double-glycine peptidase
LIHRIIIAAFVVATAGGIILGSSRASSKEVDRPAVTIQTINTQIPQIPTSTDTLTDPEIEIITEEETKPLEEESTTINAVQNTAQSDDKSAVFTVPFYSQFTDISAPQWKKIGCGIASLAMLIEFYEPGVITVDKLLTDGINSGAYITSAGWSHAGLINLSKKYGLGGDSYDMAGLSMDKAFTKLESVLEEGPVMVSVHYTFDPKNPIPHLVVINGVSNGKVYYNDPAEKTGGGSISIAKFQSAWKKRYIEIREV